MSDGPTPEPDFIVSQTGPFAIVPLWVVERVDGFPLRLYCWLAARYGGRDHRAHPSIRRLAQDLGVGDSTVHRAIGMLVTAKALRVLRYERPDGGSYHNVYQVMLAHPDGLDALVPQAEGEGANFGTPWVPNAPTYPNSEPYVPNGTSGNKDENAHATKVQTPRQKPVRRPLGDEERKALHNAFDGKFRGGAAEVDERIAEALDHTAVKKRVSEYLYCRTWLRRSYEQLGLRDRPDFVPNWRNNDEGEQVRSVEVTDYAEREYERIFGKPPQPSTPPAFWNKDG